MKNDLLNIINSNLDIQTISINNFVFSVVLSFLLSYILSIVYKRQSNTFSNPEILARIFPILSIGTTIIICVIKSSLALSLGLVGALSIVRFRTPIKEPEELTYIFLTIGLGLACGANQYSVAIISLALLIIFIYLNKKLNSRKYLQNNVSISINGINISDINKIIELISQYSFSVNFHNLSTNNEKLNMRLSFVPKNFGQINKITAELNKVCPESSFTIMDSNIFS